jgi:hypothetical protein
MTDQLNDPVPPSAWPQLQPYLGDPPDMPRAWTCVALLHPFSPPQSNDPNPTTPFFQLCVAEITCMRGQFLSAQIAGCEWGTWWYMITPAGTELSTDKGATWKPVNNIGWTLPTDAKGWFGDQYNNTACAGTSPLNWMGPFMGQEVNWWKVPVKIPNSDVRAATWMWFNSESQVPVRMMFGQGPTTPNKGDPKQLAVFQMYSFIYFPVFLASASVPKPTTWNDPTFNGFAVGNPNGYKPFVWNRNFGMTAFMTPVNEKFNPLPTRVLYIWKPNSQYSVATDRAQNTLMSYEYNNSVSPITYQEALLFGPAPSPPGPPHSASGNLATWNKDGTSSCLFGSKFPFPQEPPDWISIPAVEGTLQATITNNMIVCPNQTVTVYSVLFPPSLPNYPDSTYLWTWYAAMLPGDGKRSRPVTFMQSQSGVGVGTSLALADYFYYHEYDGWFRASDFAIPPQCSGQLDEGGSAPGESHGILGRARATAKS